MNSIQDEINVNITFSCLKSKGKNQDVLGKDCTPPFTESMILITIYVIITFLITPHPLIQKRVRGEKKVKKTKQNRKSKGKQFMVFPIEAPHEL